MWQRYKKDWKVILFWAKKQKTGVKIWKIKEKHLSLQRERRSQVEPRCAERWHLCDDEQFDLAAWFPSLHTATASLQSDAVVFFIS